MWSWNPTIKGLSITSNHDVARDGWGSDYSNDDILKESSLVSDYTHKLIKSEKIDVDDCYVIELMPLENADVVWGKIILWISEDEYISLKARYYDEDLQLVKISTLTRSKRSMVADFHR